MKPAPGDVVLCYFQGAEGKKWRPSVVVSTDLFHAHSPDVAAAELTSKITKAHLPTDYVLQDWKSAGLHQPSAFRAYFNMELQSKLVRIGRVSNRDWLEIQARLRVGLAIT
jgi:mRNA interferase MazF